MGLAAYMDLVKPKYNVPPAEDIIHCDICEHPKESVIGVGAMWVCPLCFEEMEEGRRNGRERAATID